MGQAIRMGESLIVHTFIVPQSALLQQVGGQILRQKRLIVSMM